GVGKSERVLERFLDCLGRGFHHAETLVVRLLGVLGSQVDEGTLFAALRDHDFDLATALFAEQFFEGLAVFEVDGNEDGSWNIVLVDVKLFEQRGEEIARIKGGSRLGRASQRSGLRIGVWRRGTALMR